MSFIVGQVSDAYTTL